jgi:hypothetical protein
MASAVFSFISCPTFLFHEKQSPPTQPHTSGRHCYDTVLLGALKGSLVTLLSPPQCYAARAMMPVTLASVDQCPV